MLSQHIDVDAALSKELEKKFMQVVESMVSGKITQINSEATQALIGIRKEFIRRGLEIKDMDKDLEF
jgi:hypothetical protein